MMKTGHAAPPTGWSLAHRIRIRLGDGGERGYGFTAPAVEVLGR